MRRRVRSKKKKVIRVLRKKRKANSDGLVAVDAFCRSPHVFNDDEVGPGGRDPRDQAILNELGLDTY